jgi:hypothetical protein
MLKVLGKGFVKFERRMWHALWVLYSFSVLVVFGAATFVKRYRFWLKKCYITVLNKRRISSY